MRHFFYLAALCLLFTSCGKKEKKKPEYRTPVNAVKSIKKDTPIFIETIGHVEPIVTVNVISRVKGEITGVFFEEGQYVKEKDLLFTIDPRTFQADLEKSRGTLEENLANLAFAKDKVERFAKLTEEDYFSQVDFDQLITNAAALSGVVKQNKASVLEAEVNLNYCWINSSLEGRTGILQIDKGNVLKGDESQTLVTINQMKPIYVTFSIPERELGRVRKYMHKNGALETRVAHDNFETIIAKGSLELLNNEVDIKTGMIKLRSVFKNDTEELWPNEFVRTRLILYTHANAVIIPYQAVDITTKGKYVYVVKEDQTIDMRKVVLGQRNLGNVIVLKGLKEGEIVVTEGMQNLFGGAKVKVNKIEKVTYVPQRMGKS